MKHSMFLFSQMRDGTVGTEAEMTIGFIKDVSSPRYEITTLKDNCKQNVKCLNIALFLIT